MKNSVQEHTVRNSVEGVCVGHPFHLPPFFGIIKTR